MPLSLPKIGQLKCWSEADQTFSILSSRDSVTARGSVSAVF